MRSNLTQAVFGAIAATTLVLLPMHTASAADPLEVPVTVPDNYYGGLNTYNNNPYGSPPTGDVIGPNQFDISSATIWRSTTSTTNDTLNIRINTNFAGVAGTPAADTTGYGSLFITTPAGAWNPSGVAPYASDVYQQNQWTYAVTMPVTTSQTSGASGLYVIGAVSDATANYYPGSNPVIQSYTTANGGTLVMANMNGDPISYPGQNHPYYYFRQGQVVQYLPGSGPIDPATWSITPTVWSTNPTAGQDGVVATQGSITFSIVDGLSLGDSFAFAWAITCGNDVIQGFVNFAPSSNVGANAPLPASALLMGSVLGAGGIFSAWRRRKLRGRAVAWRFLSSDVYWRARARSSRAKLSISIKVGR